MVIRLTIGHSTGEDPCFQTQYTGFESFPPLNVKHDFQTPSPYYGPVPFWWWVGEPVERERIRWQLDRLKEKGVLSAIVSYNHHACGAPNRGEPAVFSKEWWQLFRDVLEDCRDRGMTLCFQDYTLLNPVLREIGAEFPGLAGGELREVHSHVSGVGPVRVAADSGCPVICAMAFPSVAGRATSMGSLDLGSFVRDGVLEWTPPGGGEWLVSLVSFYPRAFDPMHPESGSRTIERFYRPFESECAGHLGSTIPILFQDELEFGSKMPMWSPSLPAEFQTRKGYDLMPLLPALWNDLGRVTPKVRIDYNDVAVSLMEERYFIPIFQWHESHGLLFGNDNCGRGGIEAGRVAYGDAFRTMRWYSAPGTDDPKLDGPRAFKGIKVNSSIAHLYRRPRVWNECFHSSGWGTTPADVIAALNEDLIYGATVVNLHGLYYSTYGSWWEWAPPDFHFRQPYWEHSGPLTQYVTRLCQSLSAGVHVCDVAIAYPVTALEAGLNPRVGAGPDAEIPVSERQAGKQDVTFDAAEAHAFAIGKALVDSGIDFDFIDFQSLERAEIGSAEIRVSGEAYRVLILPSMSAARFSTLEAARDLFRSGGLVIAFGCLPVASERVGSDDLEIGAIVREVFGEVRPPDVSIHAGPTGGRGIFVPDGHDSIPGMIAGEVIRDFDPAGSGLTAVHRRDTDEELYFVVNPLKKAVEAEVFFRATGPAEFRNAWTGECLPADSSPAPHGSRIALRLEAGEGRLIAFGRSPQALPSKGVATGQHVPDPLVLGGNWEFELAPTMDNRFGDFRLPVGEAMIGAEARRFRYAEETGLDASGWHLPGHDDSSWRTTTYSFGPRFWKLGPFPPGSDLAGLEAELTMRESIDPDISVPLGGDSYRWTPHEFSLRWGIENDAFLKDWAGGPHGLKGAVPDEFLDLDEAAPGSVWLLWTSVESPRGEELPFVMGSRSRYAAWMNGEPLLRQEEELPPGRQSEWNLPHYQCTPRRATACLRKGNNSLLLRFIQPEGQRMRAFAACDAPPQQGLALRWFARPGFPVFNHRPDAGATGGWYRFTAPPGLCSLKVTSSGPLRGWCAGREMQVRESAVRADGLLETLLVPQTPESAVSLVALRVKLPTGSFAGDALPEPVRFACTAGEAPLGDWSEMGLSSYSGGAWYRRSLTLNADQVTRFTTLDLGLVAATAAVRINGRAAGTLLCPPWRVKVEGLLHQGENTIEIHVANTLANHYSIGIPTPYLFPEQTRSGLFGPVSLR